MKKLEKQSLSFKQAIKIYDEALKLTPKRKKIRIPKNLLQSLYIASCVLNEILVNGDDKMRLKAIDKVMSPNFVRLNRMLMEDEVKKIKEELKNTKVEWGDEKSKIQLN